MERHRAIALALAGVVAGVLPVTASANTTAAAANCNGEGTVVSANFIRNRTTAKEVGSVQLCRTPSGYYFGWVVLYYTMAPDQYANGFLRIWPDATDPDEVLTSPRSCYDWDGQVIVAPDRTCRTPGVHPGGGPYTFRADGYVYASTGAIIAAGATARTN